MPIVSLHGIPTHYDVLGSGPPVLMFAPGGFDARRQQWANLGVYSKTRILDHLTRCCQCILFDRRECGESGGRIERVTWLDFAEQGRALLKHLNIERAHLIGGCMGCCPVLSFISRWPDAALSAVLIWPVGGVKYRISSQQRFAEHLAYVEEFGLEQVVRLVTQEGRPFNRDARGEPWASVLRHDSIFADEFVKQNVDNYKLIVGSMARTMFDRDTAPGAEPEDLLRLGTRALIVPGNDASHATSAARYLEECLPRSEYWDMPVDRQTEETLPTRLLRFIECIGGA